MELIHNPCEAEPYACSFSFVSESDFRSVLIAFCVSSSNADADDDGLLFGIVVVSSLSSATVIEATALAPAKEKA